MRWHKKSRLWVDGEIAIMSAGISHLILCRWDLGRTDSAEEA